MIHVYCGVRPLYLQAGKNLFSLPVIWSGHGLEFKTNVLKAKQGIADHEFYHYDTPLTVKHETEALYEAGFSSVEVLRNWGATYTIKAM